MKITLSRSPELLQSRYRIDASYYASTGVHSERVLKKWEQSNSKKNSLQSLGDLCVRGGLFVGDWIKRIYVNSPQNGAPYIAGSSILSIDPKSEEKYLSFRHGNYIKQLSLEKGMILMTCSGTIGNLAYVNDDFVGAVGSPDLLRIVADAGKIPVGYLFCFLNSNIGKSLILKGIYGGVIQHIEIPYIKSIPIPRLGLDAENQIHALIEKSSILRAKANAHLKKSQERFYKEVLGLDHARLQWKTGHVDAFAIGNTKFRSTNHRLDAFHYVGYAGEAKECLGKTQPMGDLVEPEWPAPFKRPYTKETGIPFISAMDLYNSNPKPRIFISRQMKGLDKYIARKGTILVQRSGQRYGLFGRPVILPRQLDNIVVSEDLMRLYPKDANDTGYIFIWLSTELGRRIVIQQSFGTSMGKLAEVSFRQMPIPQCDDELRISFQNDVNSICDSRDDANELEDQALMILTRALQMKT